MPNIHTPPTDKDLFYRFPIFGVFRQKSVIGDVSDGI